MQSETFNFNGERFVVNIGTFSTPLGGNFSFVPTASFNRGHYEIAPDELSFLSGTRFLDMGGSGDCFFQALNAALVVLQTAGSQVPAIPSDDAYKYLKVPIGTFIEDHHIDKILPNDLVLYVLREHEGQLLARSFGSGSVRVALYNTFPSHYYVSDKACSGQNVISISSFRPEVKVVNVTTRAEPLIQEDYEQPPTDFSSDPAKCVVEDVSPNYYMQFVDSRYQIKQSGKSLSQEDSKAYYKIRHNMVKTIFLEMLGMESVEEKPFTRFGIDSKRTPDFLERVNNTLILIEFTVVKKLETSYRTKQSRTKYDQEIRMLRAMNERVSSYYPTLALDSDVSGLVYDLESVSAAMDIPLSQPPQPIFKEIQTLISSTEYNIGELMPELLLLESERSGVGFQIPGSQLHAEDSFHRVSKLLGVKRKRSQMALAMIRRNSKKLENFLKRVYYRAKFCIFINVKANNIYLEASNAGVPKNQMLNMVQNLSTDVLKYVVFQGHEEDTDEPFATFGRAKLVVEDDRPQLSDEYPDTEGYESYYLNKIRKVSREGAPSTLADDTLSDQVVLVESKYLKLLSEKRKHERVRIYDKNFFVMPVCTDAVQGEFEGLKLKTGLTLTDFLLSHVKTVERSEKQIVRDVDFDKMNHCLTQMNKKFIAIKLLIGGSFARFVKSASTLKKQVEMLEGKGVSVTPELLAALEEFNFAKGEVRNEVKEDTRKAYRNRVQVTRSFYKSNWNSEMEHFNQEKGIIKVSEERDMLDLDLKFQTLLAHLWNERPESATDDIYSNTRPTGDGLKSLLEEMREAASDTVDYLKRTQILHDLQFYSRMCYTLLYFSNIKLNKEDFVYDNLGYKDVLLFVKGGKKILSTKKSRLFKLLYPVNENFEWLYCSKFTKKVTWNGRLYICTPWQVCRFTTLKLGTELYYTFTNYFVSSYLESNISLELYKKFVSTKVLNMYSQRRKVEVWFGYFRYLYLNSLSTHTSLLSLVDDMVDFDYDPYFYYMQRKFSSGYIDIYEHAKKLNIYDLLTKVVFTNFDLCAEKFDESLFMPKAPFERENEHLKNLRSILETHKQFIDKFGQSSPGDILRKTSVSVYDENYFDKLFQEDFNIDPQLCFSVGKYAGEYLSRSVTEADMAAQFSSIVNKSYTKISTSKGMRSSEGRFWGQKGHEVIYDNTEMYGSVEGFLKNFPQTYKEFNDVKQATHISFKEKIEALKDVQLEFDMKDKEQWKGSREIYVMSEKTKLLQSPLEMFFKFLCQWTPNEIIHKPSHVRPKFIHSQVFEFSEVEDNRMFATLDCRKWAPKSNLWKYYYFVKGMEHKLPKEFCEYFYTVWALMFDKRVRIQARYVEVLSKNAQTASLVETLHKRADGDYEMIMPYSFMMGIFNYLSSLLHAFGQLYFNDKIARAQGATVNLIAHSDDSGGVFLAKDYETNVLIYRQYEMFQKGLNHLMSKKKSSLSPNYFEMISIMYAESRLIPMTHKFLSNVSFEPKGKGWVDDISTIVSKIVELYSNGASHLQCYLTMLAMSEMIRKFYHVPRLVNLSQIPLAFGGVFNMHPIHLILLGADAQEVMLDLEESPGVRAFRIKCYQVLCKDYVPGKGAVVNYKIPYYKSHSYSGKLTADEMSTLKLVSSCFPGETLMDAMAHYSRMSDTSYVYSLEGVDMCQIFTMTLFTKTSILKGEGGFVGLSAFTKMYAALKEIGVFSNYNPHPYSQFHNYMKASESMKVSFSDICVPSQKTCKPIVYSTFSSLGMGLTFKQVNEIIAYNSGDQYKVMFPDLHRLEALTHWAKTNLKIDDTSDLVRYLTKVSSKDVEKIRSSYCFMPSGINLDTTERFWTYSVFYTTRRYLISKRKPQYFTMDQFRLWNADYDSLKHYYLLLKLAFKGNSPEAQKKLVRNSHCHSCVNSTGMTNMVEEVFRIKSLPNWTTLTTSLPFAVYHEEQRRSMNVWFGASSFTLYTMAGSVEMKKKDGEYHYLVTLADESLMDQIWFLLRNFLHTRGIVENRPEYGLNDSSEFRLGFNDMNKPMAMSPGSKGMMIRNSRVTVGNFNMPTLNKEESIFRCEGLVVDFEIYYNYDLNPSFYDQHKLADIKDMIFEKNYTVDSKKLMDTMLSSQLYKILMCDPSHQSYGNMKDKYNSAGLLGDERSLTRALALANEKGVTSYVSSVNTYKPDMAILENLSYKDIPVLDLIENFTFSRVTYKEIKIMQRLMQDQEINDSEAMVLDRIVQKMGAKPTFNALTTLRVTFSQLSYTDVHDLDVVVIEGFLYTMVKACLSVIKNRPSKRSDLQFAGTNQEVSQSLYTMIALEEDAHVLGPCLARICLRAQFDSPSEFWDKRKSNLYCSLIHPNERYIKNLSLFMISVVQHLRGAGMLNNKLLTIRQLVLASRAQSSVIPKLSKKCVSLKEEVDYFSGRPAFLELEETNFRLDPDSDEFEDDLDAVYGGDEPENPIEREWGDEDEEELNAVVVGLKPFMGFCEMVVKQNYQSITVLTFNDSFYVPWLGRSDRQLVQKFGCVWYEYTFEGRILKHRGASTRKEIPIPRLEPKNISIKPLEERVEKTVSKADIFKLGTDDEVYDYQINMLKSLGLTDAHKYSHLFFRHSDVATQRSFWNIISRFVNKKVEDKKIRPTSIKRRSLVIPGFTGNLADSKARAELNALFSGHGEEIATGNHQINERSRKMLISSLQRLYQSCSDSLKACIVTILSTLKDAIISDESDAWYLDSILACISHMEDSLTAPQYEMSIPKALDSELAYEQSYEYDDL
nr:MAG: RNA-dependent RNA polymerase [Sanya bunya-like virus 17]